MCQIVVSPRVQGPYPSRPFWWDLRLFPPRTEVRSEVAFRLLSYSVLPFIPMSGTDV